MSSQEIEEICPICFELLKNEENIYITKCSHIYHKDCLSKWLKKAFNCPTCRNEIEIDKTNFPEYLGKSRKNSRTSRIGLDSINTIFYESLISPITYSRFIISTEIETQSGIIRSSGRSTPIFEGELNERDIELVIDQSGSSRELSINALRNNNNDIVNAIMELTM